MKNPITFFTILLLSLVIMTLIGLRTGDIKISKQSETEKYEKCQELVQDPGICLEIIK